MPQTFQVLRCYSCFVFQVHPTKKSYKFECKLCSAKQSIKRHYGLGTGKECRIHVQKLNGIRGTVNETSSSQDVEDSDELNSNENINVNYVKPKREESIWLKYVDKNEVENVPHDSILGDDEVFLEFPNTRRRYDRNNKFKTNKNTFENDKVDNDITKQCRKRKFLKAEENIVTISPSISECEVKTEPSLSSLKTENDGSKNIAKQFIPPVINKSSKWAQFADTNDEIPFDLNEESNVTREQKHVNFLGTSEDTLNNHNTFNVPEERCAKKFNSCEHLSLQSRNQEGKPPKKFVQPVFKHSKWAQYNKDDIKQNLHHMNEFGAHQQSTFSSSKPQKLFSLCDDNDLDTVLDI